jgi:hypothetical protein
MNTDKQILLPRALTFLGLVFLVGCAAIPEQRKVGIDHSVPLEVVVDEAHVRIELFVDRTAIRPRVPVRQPVATLAQGAYPGELDPKSAELVANNAARSFCNELAPYVNWSDQPAEDALAARLVVTAIVPTSRAAAGASAVADIFIPGPARLPAGLGALAVDADLVAADGRTVAAIRWARGANAVTDNAQVSMIGDAWQLADEFGEELAEALIVDRQQKEAVRLEKVDAEQIAANRAQCRQWFGYVNPAAIGAGRLVPLTPELIDPGAPKVPAAEDSPPPKPAEPPSTRGG